MGGVLDNDDGVHLDGFGKADGLACQTLDAHAQRQMLPFNLLRVPFARLWTPGPRCRA